MVTRGIRNGEKFGEPPAEPAFDLATAPLAGSRGRVVIGKPETGVPLPPSTRSPSPITEAACSLEVNQSILITGAAKQTVASALTRARKHTGGQFAYRLTGKPGEIRIWRTA